MRFRIRLFLIGLIGFFNQARGEKLRLWHAQATYNERSARVYSTWRTDKRRIKARITYLERKCDTEAARQHLELRLSDNDRWKEGEITRLLAEKRESTKTASQQFAEAWL